MSQDIAEGFRRDVIDGWTNATGTKTIRPHEMTVLHEEGLYRHVRFKSPDSGGYWFDLITWPGCLTVNGDCGTFTFARTEDMFEFFRGHRVNPGYWAEKVRGEIRVKSYSEPRFRKLVAEYAQDAEKDWPGLTDAVNEEVLGGLSELATYNEDGAREALRDFEFGGTYTASCSCGDEAEGLAYFEAEQRRVGHVPHTDRRSMHKTEVKHIEGFRFTDTWEWDLSDWDWTFLWCLHAIVWGIAQYDKQRAAVTT